MATRTRKSNNKYQQPQHNKTPSLQELVLGSPVPGWVDSNWRAFWWLAIISWRLVLPTAVVHARLQCSRFTLQCTIQRTGQQMHNDGRTRPGQARKILSTTNNNNCSPVGTVPNFKCIQAKQYQEKEGGFVGMTCIVL